MGAFKIEIVGVGGHGCDRKAKTGEKLHGRCRRLDCPDCLAHEFVQQLRQRGMVREGDQAMGQELLAGQEPPFGAEIYTVPTDPGRRFWRKPQQALFTHWPDSPSEVVDDMLRNERKSGQF